MSYQITDAGEFSVVALTGEVDLSCSAQARQTILSCLEANKGVLVDLSSVSYIDSSGVASLVEGFQVAKKQGLEFGLVGVSDSALSVLRLARLDKVFDIHASVEERLAGSG
ncbi:MAG: STAS domain-containing protein [Pseudomonadota bacterium]